MAARRDPIVLVEIDLWNGSSVQTLRLANFGPISRATTTGWVHFDPRLRTPFTVGSRITSGDFGNVLTTTGNNGGTVEFALGRTRVGAQARTLDPDIWPWLSLHWAGRPMRVYQGQPGQDFPEFLLAYIGRVDDLSHDTLRAQIKLSDASIDLDDPLVDELYVTDDTIPDSIQERPKPELRGAADNIAPILLSDSDLGAPFIYQVSRKPLADIPEVRVGGIKWDRVVADPVAGQWAPDLTAGTFTLGGITQGLDVRCDARAFGWETLTTASLMRQLVTEAGGVVDEDSLTALEAAAPYLIGWWTDTTETNRLDALDQIMTAVVGWWAVGIDGRFAAGVFAAPGAPDVALTGVEVESCSLTGLLPPAWRIRVEHTRNWSPTTSFADAVIEADKLRWEEGGIIAAAYENAAIKVDEKRAVDMPLIRSLVRNETDALAIRDRAAAVFGVPRRLYEAKAWIDPPTLYRTASVDYAMVSGNLRVHGVTRGFGAGATTLNLWG